MDKLLMETIEKFAYCRVRKLMSFGSDGATKLIVNPFENGRFTWNDIRQNVWLAYLQGLENGSVLFTGSGKFYGFEFFDECYRVKKDGTEELFSEARYSMLKAVNDIINESRSWQAKKQEETDDYSYIEMIDENSSIYADTIGDLQANEDYQELYRRVTDRQKEVLNLIECGIVIQKEIADILGFSCMTISRDFEVIQKTLAEIKAENGENTYLYELLPKAQRTDDRHYRITKVS